MSFGRTLREEREARGVSLENIAHATKVSVRHLDALERDADHELPGGIFNRGIIHGYCRTLGLDEQTWIERYDAGHPNGNLDWAEFAEAVKRNRVATPRPVQRRWWGVLLMLLGLAFLAGAAWHFVLKPRFGRTRQTPVNGSARLAKLPSPQRWAALSPAQPGPVPGQPGNAATRRNAPRQQAVNE